MSLSTRHKKTKKQYAMTSTIFQNRVLYCQLMRDYLDNKIKSFEFIKRFLAQKQADIDEDEKAGYNKFYQNRKLDWKELKFQEYYVSKLSAFSSNYQDKIDWKEYMTGVQQYEITGEPFFFPLFNRLQEVDLEDFWPKNAEEAEVAGWDSSKGSEFPKFSEEEHNEWGYIDEDELRKRIKEKLCVLEENKERWI